MTDKKGISHNLRPIMFLLEVQGTELKSNSKVIGRPSYLVHTYEFIENKISCDLFYS